MKRSFLTLLILLSSTVSIAQQSNLKIYGKVVDKLTKQPLPGANVLVVNTNFGASTDLNGKFEIKNLSSGEYQIRASIIGYRSVTKTDVLKLNNLNRF